ncbi:hypothetical protein OROGR_001811 [Orobanche gracilis]
MWNWLEHNIKEGAKEVLGESKGNGPSSKDTSWWNEEVKQAIKTKRECYKVLGKCSNNENYERYKKARTEAKKAVRNARSEVNKELYARLDTKEGEKDIYKLARMREKKTRDIGKVKCVKDNDQNVLVQDKEIKERWRSYFDTLFNGHQEQDIGNLKIPSSMVNREFKRRIQKGEVAMALKKMGSKKGEGPDGIPIEVWSNKMPSAWRKKKDMDTLEARGFRLSRSKTEYMECRFSDNSDREAGMITFDGKVVHGSTFFRYLGSIIQKDGELDGDVAHRIKAGWLKWKSATGVLCDPDMPHRLKGKFYRTTIRPMNVAEMRMLRWMCGHTKKDRLRNEVIREKVRVASIEDKMMENRLRWFGHVRRRPVEAPVRRLEI